MKGGPVRGICLHSVQKAWELGTGGHCCRHVAIADYGDTENPKSSCGEAIHFLMVFFFPLPCAVLLILRNSLNAHPVFHK